MKLNRKTPAPGRSRRQTTDNSRSGSFSYYARRSNYDFNTGRQVQREALQVQERVSRFKRSSRLKHLSAVLFTVAVAYLLTYSSTQPVMQLATPKDDKNAILLQPASAYQQQAASALKQSLLNHNKITLQRDHVAEAVSKAFPEVGDVTVVAPLLGSHPTVFIAPVNPVLIATGSNGPFVVDDTGTVIAPVSRLQDIASLKLPTVDDVSSGPLQVGQQAFTSDDVAFIHTVVTELAAKQLTVSRLTLPKGTAELDAFVAGQPFFVKFNLQNAKAREQAGTFLAVWDSLQHQHVTPSYIDVRVDGRAYYK